MSLLFKNKWQKLPFNILIKQKISLRRCPPWSHVLFLYHLHMKLIRLDVSKRLEWVLAINEGNPIFSTSWWVYKFFCLYLSGENKISFQSPHVKKFGWSSLLVIFFYLLFFKAARWGWICGQLYPHSI